MALTKVQDGGLNLTDAGMPAGSVLQVIVGTLSSSTTTTSTSLVDTGLTASITPSSSSNKILVLATITGAGVANGDGVRMKLFSCLLYTSPSPRD